MSKRKRSAPSIPDSLSAYLWGALRTDFSEVKQLIQLEYSEILTNDFTVEELLEELFRYLLLLTEYSKNEDIEICPSSFVDKAYLCLLADPMMYYRVCDEILSLADIDCDARPIRILPRYSLEAEESIDERNGRFDTTMDKYNERFGHEANSEIWQRFEEAEVDYMLLTCP